MKLCQNDQPMSRLYGLNLRLIGPKLWIFYYWPIFWLVSFFSLQSLIEFAQFGQVPGSNLHLSAGLHQRTCHIRLTGQIGHHRGPSKRLLSSSHPQTQQLGLPLTMLIFMQEISIILVTPTMDHWLQMEEAFEKFQIFQSFDHIF